MIRMANYIQTVSGHAVVPGWPGPDNFLNVGGRGWTDQQGFGIRTGKRFRIKANKTVEFFAPITNPVVFNDVRLRANFAAVTLSLQPQDAFLIGFSVMDRLAVYFEQSGLNVTGDFSNVWNTGSNAFNLPDTPVDGHLVIVATIRTDADADVTFTGAGITFHN
jgi:hypothetical protein